MAGGMPSNLEPPTFIPGSPCCQPWITLLSGKLAGWPRLYDESKIFPGRTRHADVVDRQRVRRGDDGTVTDLQVFAHERRGRGPDFHGHVGRAGGQRISKRDTRLARSRWQCWSGGARRRRHERRVRIAGRRDLGAAATGECGRADDGDHEDAETQRRAQPLAILATPGGFDGGGLGAAAHPLTVSLLARHGLAS